MDDAALLPQETKDPEKLDQLYRLRPRAWAARAPSFPKQSVWREDIDERAIHWVIEDSGAVIAGARLTIHRDWTDVANAEVYQAVSEDDFPSPFAVLGRLVVHPQYAGRGLSAKLDGVRMKKAISLKCEAIWGATLVPARIRALKSQGFKNLGVKMAYTDGPLAEIGGEKPANISQSYPTILMHSLVQASRTGF